MLTGQFGSSVRVFESLSYSVVQTPTSQHEEQNQTQLKGEGQHAQHDNGAVNCLRWRAEERWSGSEA